MQLKTIYVPLSLSREENALEELALEARNDSVKKPEVNHLKENNRIKKRFGTWNSY